MSPKELEQIAQLICGDRWKISLARRLGVSRALIEGWWRGTIGITQERADQIYGLCWENIRQIIRCMPIENRQKKLEELRKALV